jgi:ATP-dependent Zn protease
MRTTLDAMAALLIEKEVISGDEVKQVIAGEGAG